VILRSTNEKSYRFRFLIQIFQFNNNQSNAVAACSPYSSCTIPEIGLVFIHQPYWHRASLLQSDRFAKDSATVDDNYHHIEMSRVYRCLHQDFAFSDRFFLIRVFRVT
jgi:hypothetical protein